MRRLIDYQLKPTGSFTVDYDEAQNALIHAYVGPNSHWTRTDQGQSSTDVKFSSETVESYVEQSLGASIPVFIEELGVIVWSKNDLDKLKTKLSEDVRNLYLRTYPKLMRSFTSGMPNPMEPFKQVVYQAGTFEGSADGPAKVTVTVDLGPTTFMSATGAALTDLREVLPEDVALQHIQGVLRVQTNDG